MESTYTVYVHTSPSQKRYVGITCKPTATRRWGGGGQGYKDNSYFCKAIAKYGWDNITHEILAIGLTKDAAESMEIELIERFNLTNHANGYNLSPGGGSRSSPSQETRAKMSASGKGKRRSFGFKHTEEFKAKRRAALLGNTLNLGHKHTEEAKRKMSESRKGRNLGKKLSDETKGKISAATMGRYLGTKKSDETKAKMSAAQNKPVIMYQGEEEVARYKSATEAAINIGIDISGIARACRGAQKMAGGYCWRYARTA